MCTLVPYIAAAGELKTKPTQHSVKELLSIGIQPDILLCRTDRFLSKEIKSKIALFCNVENEAVITAKDVASIYEVPLNLAREGVDRLLMKYLHMEAGQPDLSEWEALVHRAYNPGDEVAIGIVGKYVEYEDSYKSLKEALVHAALHFNLKLRAQWIEAEGLETKDDSYKAQMEGFDGILVPGGFGKRGIAGMLNGIRYAREYKVPYFGICLGMQTACIEFARNVCGLENADSSEFDPATPHRVIYKLRELRGVEELGGTMRLGAWPCKLEPGSFAHRAYGVSRDQRAPPPPLRVQPRVRGVADRRGAEDHRHDSRRHLRRDRRNRRPSLFPGLPVPSRIQVQAAGAASAVRGLYQGILRKPEAAPDRRQDSHRRAVPASAERRQKIGGISDLSFQIEKRQDTYGRVIQLVAA